MITCWHMMTKSLHYLFLKDNLCRAEEIELNCVVALAQRRKYASAFFVLPSRRSDGSGTSKDMCVRMCARVCRCW